MKNNSVEGYILANERNMRITEAVCDAWEQARQSVVKVLLERLRTNFAKQLPHWQFEPFGRFFEDTIAGFSLSKPNWKYYWINLQCEDKGKSIVIGVVRDFNLLGKRPLHPKLLEAVRSKVPSARSRKWWWEALVKIRSPAEDWSTPEALWQMYKDKCFADDVAEQVVTVAKASERILDRLSRRK